MIHPQPVRHLLTNSYSPQLRFVKHWPSIMSKLASYQLTLIPMPLANFVFGPQYFRLSSRHMLGGLWCRKWIAILCDNQAVVSKIDKGCSSCPLIMLSMRRIKWVSVTQNFILLHPEFLHLYLNHSKTVGACTVLIARTGGPFRSMPSYLKMRAPSDSLTPIFMTQVNYPI